jgi:hypothetical protein
MKLAMTGRILLFKGFKMESDEVFSDFRRVASDLTFAQGVNLLVAEREKMKREQAAAAGPNSETKTQPPAETKKTPQ